MNGSLTNGISMRDIISAVIAIVCVGAMVYLCIEQVKIPEVLSNTVVLILGYYFGVATQKIGAK